MKTLGTRKCTSTNTGGTTGQTIGVARDYIIHTLCDDDNVLRENSTAFTQTSTMGVVSVEKGILIYTLYKMGEHAVDQGLAATGEPPTQHDILRVQMNFLPGQMYSEWTNAVRTRIPLGTTTTRKKVLQIWSDFLASTIYGNGGMFPGINGPFYTTTGGETVNISQDILLYTLYREGACEVENGVPEGTTVGREGLFTMMVDFLPSEFIMPWCKTLKDQIPTDTKVDCDQVLRLWKKFVYGTLATHGNRLVESYSAFTPQTADETRLRTSVRRFTTAATTGVTNGIRCIAS